MNQGASNIRFQIHFGDTHTCSVLESLKPGQKANVLVVPEDDAKAEPIKARAIRTKDGKDVFVEMPDGVKVDWSYHRLVKEAIPHYKGLAKSRGR